MLNLTKRPCKLGNSMSTNTEKHGDEDVGAIDLPLDGIMLTAAELDAILGDGTHDALYVRSSNGNAKGLSEVRFPQLKPLAFKEHFEGARVDLWLGYEDGDARVGFSGAKVRNVKLTLQAGGLTKLECSIRATPDPEEVAQLYDFLNHEGSVGIRNGKVAEPKAKDKQKSLPLAEGAEDESAGATAH